jgi:uncharacterized RDD family membrane protein YckC
MANGMSTTVDAPQVETLSAAGPPQEDLSKYDSRRAIARAVDGVFVGAPFLIPVLGLGFALSVAIVAISLLYFFVCEALWGRTLGKRLLGLRVLMRDGGPATAKAVALRTSTRIVEDGPIGLAVFLASGKRRGRLRRPARRHDRRAPRARPAARRLLSPPDRRPGGHRGRRHRGRAGVRRALREAGLSARRRQDVQAQHRRRPRIARARARRHRGPQGRRAPQARRGRRRPAARASCGRRSSRSTAASPAR